MSTANEDRARRLAAALRDNLHRRKAQARAVAAPDSAPAPAPGPDHAPGPDSTPGTALPDMPVRRAPDAS